MQRSLRSDLRALVRGIARFFAGAPGWVAGVVIAIQALVLGYGLVWVAMVAVLILPDLEPAATWEQSADVAANVWLLSHGVPIHTAEARLSLMPVGLTLVIAFMIASLSWRFSVKSWGCWLVATAAYATGVALVAAMRWTDVDQTIAITWRAGIWATVVAGVAVAVGLWRAHGARLDWWRRLPVPLRSGVSMAVITMSLWLMLAAAVGLASAFRNRHAAADVVSSLGFESTAGVSVAMLQTAYVPVVTVWLVAWLAGPGFALGDAAVVAPGVTSVDALPAIPLLEALPLVTRDSVTMVPLLLVAVAALVWWAWTVRAATMRDSAVAAAIALPVVGIAMWAAFAMTGGAMGPGSLAQVGVDAVPTAVLCAGLAGAGFAAALIVTAAVGGVRQLLAPGKGIPQSANRSR